MSSLHFFSSHASINQRRSSRRYHHCFSGRHVTTGNRGLADRELCRTPTPSQAPGCGIRFHSRKPVSKPGSCSGILGGHRETSRRIPHKIRPFLALWRRSSLYQNNRYTFVPGYSSLLVISSRIIVVATAMAPQSIFPGEEARTAIMFDLVQEALVPLLEDPQRYRGLRRERLGRSFERV
jgi:hypothetical protein